MAYLTNLDEVVPALRERLRDYLVLKLGIKPHAKKFKCFMHDDSDPSMYFNPKAQDQTVRCFSCSGSADIFTAASHLESLPSTGSEWVTQTIPHLAELLEIPISMGEPSPLDKERLKLHKLTQDIADLLATSDLNKDYIRERSWTTDDILIGSITEEELVTRLLERGWTHEEISVSLMVHTNNHHFFGEDRLTFTIKDFRGRPVAFQSRNLSGQGMKYINTPETAIYTKGKNLLGIDVALKKGHAKRHGLYIVEGPGDLAQLYRAGIYNAAAVCGTALTTDHLALLKMLGVHTIYLCLDWDAAGVIATQRILKQELSGVAGISCWVVDPPTEGSFSDADDFMKGYDDPTRFTNLPCVSGFEWMMKHISDNQSPGEVCEQLIPTIAAEPTAIKRELLARTLSQYTSVSLQSVLTDVDTLRNGRQAERRERLLGAVKRYSRGVETDPGNVQAIMSQHEEDIAYIEKEYEGNIIGVNYQLARFEALAERRRQQNEGGHSMEFNLTRFSLFKEAMANGMDWTTGILGYMGGRENSGKTATMIALAVDIAMSDPEAIVMGHFTDDTYEQVEPRFRSTIAEWLREYGDPKLKIAMANNPQAHCTTSAEVEMFHRANDTFRDLISNERLILLDMQDGKTLGALEKNLRYVRSRYPNKKLFVACDNTHKYTDHPTQDQNSRMRQISDTQKTYTGKYQCCMVATVEYRKNAAFDSTKIRLPVNDDIADARALKYNCNFIIHVYNDLNDRADAAEIFWVDPEYPDQRQPRLMLHFGKNKVSEFKEKLVMDLDVKSVTLRQKPKKDAEAEFEAYLNAKEGGERSYDGNATTYIEAEY